MVTIKLKLTASQLQVIVMVITYLKMLAPLVTSCIVFLCLVEAPRAVIVYRSIESPEPALSTDPLLRILPLTHLTYRILLFHAWRRCQISESQRPNLI